MDLMTVFVIIYFIFWLLFLICFVFLFRKRKKAEKNTYDKTVIPQYEMIKGVTPALMQVAFTSYCKRDGLIASLVDLSVRGYLKIILHKGKVFKEKTKNSIEFSNVLSEYVLLKDYKNDSNLLDYEKELLNCIFKNNEKNVKDVGSFDSFLSDRQVLKIYDLIYKISVEKNIFYKSPEAVRRKYKKYRKICLWLGIILLVAGGLGLPILLCSLLFHLYYKTLPRRTDFGWQIKWHTLGLQMYLYHAERYRLLKTARGMEKILPAAILFDLSLSWVKYFSKYKDYKTSWLKTGESEDFNLLINFFNKNLKKDKDKESAASFYN